ncbi:receptor-type tyrosine-protein phosphatase beta-like isoform X10 [Polypterus senegalus]|uniref:receptor-type tyrosine-protein phosphatase beta-like isoform X10 n=1 Tax=Polypterus senegalus TaxID=55291 RepID=UPI0019661B1C|nr:receptor-type tyrosine-protein phosphatase beta-like isoform X10 [Polypterus senegalus]
MKLQGVNEFNIFVAVFCVLTFQTLFVCSEPGPVTSPTVTGVTTTSIFLCWGAPLGGNVSYGVNFSISGQAQQLLINQTCINVTNLNSATSYSFTVFAVAGDNTTVSDPTTITGFTKPGPVTLPSITNVTTTSIFLCWGAPLGGSVSYGVNFSNSGQTQQLLTNQICINVTSLNSATSYSFTVFAVAGDNTTVSDPTTITGFTKPGPVTSPTVTSVTTTSIFLCWVAPLGGNVSYGVNFSISGQAQQLLTNQTCINVTNLNSATSYSFTVFAVAGDNTTVSDSTTITAFTKPGPVTSLTVTNVTTTSIFLCWVEPLGGSFSYRVHFSISGQTQQLLTIRTCINVNSLNSATSYSFTVFAVAGDFTTVSDPATITGFTRPGPVTSLTVTNVTTTSIFLCWVAPLGGNVSYGVNFLNSGQTQQLVTNQTCINVTNLNSATSYSFTVFAVVGDNTTVSDSATIIAFTKPGPVTSLTFTNVTTTSVFLCWVAPLGGNVSYGVNFSNSGQIQQLVTNRTCINVTNLNSATSYSFTVFAVAGDNTTISDSASITAFTRPGPVTSPIVTNVTTTSVFLCWVAPLEGNVFYGVNFSNSGQTQQLVTNRTCINVTNLNSATSYSFTVFAVAGDNTTISDSATITAFTKPGPVTSLTFTNVTTTSIFLCWVAPLGGNVFYGVNFSNSGQAQQLVTNRTCIDVTNLNSATSYSFTVFAVAGDNTTFSDSATITAFTRPGPVTSPIVTNVTTTSIFLCWVAPLGGNVSYGVNFSNSGQSQQLVTNHTCINVTNLNSATSYSFTVFTVAGDNTTISDSATITAFTRPGPVTSPTVTNVTTTSTFLCWVAPVGGNVSYGVNFSNSGQTQQLLTNQTCINVTNLNSATSYSFTVFAVAGDNTTVSDSTTITAFTRPGPVTSPTVTNVTTTSVFLCWVAPLGGNVSYGVNFSNSGQAQQLVTNRTCINVTNLNSATSYSFTIFAVAGDNTTISDSSTITAFTRPGPVTSLTVTNVTITSIFLCWVAPLGENVSYGVNFSNSGQMQQLVTNHTCINVTNLNSATSYSFTVFAVSGDNTTISDSATITAFTKPGPVTSPTVTNVTTTSIFLCWVAPFGGNVSYRVNFSNSGQTQQLLSSRTCINVTSLNSATSYSFTVFAVAGDNTTVSDSATISAFTKPGSVTSPTVTNVTTTSIFLCWVAPLGGNVFYGVNFSNSGQAQQLVTNRTCINVTNLNSATSYTFTVFAVAGDNTTISDSATITAFTKPGPVTSLTFTNVTTTSIFLCWVAPLGGNVSYGVNFSNSGQTQQLVTNRTCINVTNLNSATSYSFTVFAVAGDNTTVSDSTTITAFTKPGPVTSPTVTNVTTTSIFLCWVAPLGGNVFYGVNFSNSGQAQQLVTNRTCINVTNLISATSYSFTVFAVAGDNTTVSDSATITAFTKPGPVISPTVTNVTTTSIFLCWVAPLGGNVSYGVNFSNSGHTQQLLTNQTCINVTNLISATSYSFTIFAVAGDNTTISDSSTITAFTKPGPVTSLTFTNVTTTSIFLCWVAPLGGNVSYGVNFSNSGQTQQLVTNRTCINVTNLNSATSYSFTVFAVAGDNTTVSDSTTITAFTKPGPVPSPTVTSVTTTSIFLCWVAPLGGNVSYGVNFSNSGQAQQLVTNRTCINVTNLNSATSYSFTVFAVAGDNTTVSDSATITAFTKPGPVISPTVTNVTTTSIFLCWVAPLGGNVSYGVNFSNSGHTQQLLTNQTCINVTNLISATSYSFTIFAVAGDNTTISDSSTITAFTKPGPVTSLTFTNVTTTSVFLCWVAPLGGNVSYGVNFSISGQTQQLVTNHTCINVTNLNSATSYSFTVFAVAGDNTTVSDSTAITAFTKPGPVTSPTVTNVTTTSIFFCWVAPLGGNVSYGVNFSNSGQTQQLVTKRTCINVTNLNSATSYYFTVFAVAGDNTTVSDPTTITAFTKPGPVTSPTVTNVTTTSIFLCWVAPLGGNVSYGVNFSNSGQTQQLVTNHTCINVTNLNSATSYSFTVFAVAGDNTTISDSVTITAFTSPGPVISPTVTSVTTSSIFLCWVSPLGGNVSYGVNFSISGQTEQLLTNQTCLNVTNLNSSTSYSFTVFAVAGDNTTISDSATITAFTKPDTISSLRATDVTTTSILLSWTAPQRFSNSYKIKIMNSGSVFLTKETSFKVTELLPGTSYTFSIAGVAADSKTEGDPIFITNCTNAAAVINANCFGPNYNAILNISWQPPSGLYTAVYINSYTVYSPATFYVIEGLNYFTTYPITLINAGCGGNSTPVVLNCQTGITSPPDVPDVNVLLNKPSTTSQTITFTFKPFSSSNGPVLHYAIIVTSNTDNDIPDKSVLIKTYNDYTNGQTDTYVATIIVTTVNSAELSVVIGDGNVYNAYVNGPLDSTKSYKIALAGFTKLNLTAESRASTASKIDIVNSVFSFTHFSAIITLINSGNSALIGGLVGGILGALVILIVAFFIHRRRQRRSHLSSKIDINPIPISEFTKIIPVEHFEKYYVKQRANQNYGFAVEFVDIQTVGTTQPKIAALCLENKVKNRYSNILPYDESRVKLSVGHEGDPNDDYINASYLPGYNSNKEFIGTQGPLPNTVKDFWRMVWEQNVHTLVMLTQCNEKGRVKCEKYWPSSNSQTHGHMQVALISETPTKEWTIRELSLENLANGNKRRIKHFHFTAWPDHGVPENTDLLIRFRNLVREHIDQSQRNSPTVVHCSAGVGRTGTLIALDHVIHQIDRTNSVNVYKIVCDLRMHRPLMVQSENQYIFLNDCIMNVIRSKQNSNQFYKNNAAEAIYENITPARV